LNESIKNIKKAYSERLNYKVVYPITRNDILIRNHQREQAILGFLHRFHPTDFSQFSLLEIGCGGGSDLLNFLRFGFSPSKLYGNELLNDRYLHAKSLLPTKVKLYNCDAFDMCFDINSFNFIYQSMVFSSILDNKHRKKLAQHIYNILKPGGTLMWYDSFYNNPFNRDVHGIKVSSIRKLFPEYKIKVIKCTLCPPIAKRVCTVMPLLYMFLKMVQDNLSGSSR
jgi:SAM-dependent methyltransferase